MDEINLPGLQEKLIKAVLSVQQNVVLVIVTGNPISIDNIMHSVPSILTVFYPVKCFCGISKI